ncbi:MAG: glycosyltransferase family 2 protein [Prevotella sp.]|nr:glycosyltransferase family 2 protein [Prevotella sp.]
MKTNLGELSILIPTYNHNCTVLVRHLQQQAELLGIPYEILVADDGSTENASVEENKLIDGLPNCRYIIRTENVGRAAIRNFLCRESQYQWVLYIDSDMTVESEAFLSRYVEQQQAYPSVAVVDGGVSIGGNQAQLKHNLRYLYEKSAEPDHVVARRQQRPYHDIHTANLMVRRDVMCQHPFDERFRHYGYEDVLFGIRMKQQRIGIRHIDNPLGFNTFESNADFVSKTEEGLRTLYEFRSELRGYSRMLTLVDGIHLKAVKGFIRLWHAVAGGMERRMLVSRHPILGLFKLYKLGYYLSIDKH